MNAKPFNLAVRAVILDDQGRCLMLRRSAHNKNFVGMWEWPGGKVDPGETFDVAVRREVAEEAGLQIEPTGVAGAFHIEMATMRLAILCLEATLCGGELRLSNEHDDAFWVPLAEVGKWKQPPGLGEFAESYAMKKMAQP